MTVAGAVRRSWERAPAAHFADGDSLRLILTRRWDWSEGARPMIAWMLNPSKAGALDDDPTVRKCMGFARRDRAGGLVVVNWSPVVATDPAALFARDDLHLRRSSPFILHAISQLRPKVVLAAWGGTHGPKVRKADPDHWHETLRRATISTDLWCIDECKSGDPAHPLYQSYSKGMRVWRFST